MTDLPDIPAFLDRRLSREETDALRERLNAKYSKLKIKSPSLKRGRANAKTGLGADFGTSIKER